MGTTSSISVPKEIRIPVSEVFGPTIQGEGPLAGTPCHFIRFGGCDYRCVWCDSAHAVLPNLVREAPKLSVAEIMGQLIKLEGAPRWVIFSGGNPCLHRLETLVSALRDEGYRIQVETQGTLWKSWLNSCTLIVVSPKPPSARQNTNLARLQTFLAAMVTPVALKVVVFNNEDFEFAREVHKKFPKFDFYLSVGNIHPAPVNPEETAELGFPDDAESLRKKFRWLAEKTAVDSDMTTVKVLPQLHLLAWANERGR